MTRKEWLVEYGKVKTTSDFFRISVNCPSNLRFKFDKKWSETFIRELNVVLGKSGEDKFDAICDLYQVAPDDVRESVGKAVKDLINKNNVEVYYG